MNKIERVQAVLAGRRPDRPPVSFWYHFASEAVSGPPAIDAHLKHLEKWDLDYLKVMNDNGYPRDVATIADADDLLDLTVHGPDAPQFADQLGLIEGLAKRLKGQVLMTTTIFNPWAVLRGLTEPVRSYHGPPVLALSEDARDQVLSSMLELDRKRVGLALMKIAESLAGFARACIQAGADGIFLSVRDDWVDTERNGRGTYDELVAPADRLILDAARDASFNMLHACGKPQNLERFAGYPNVHVINWADRAAGPSIAEVRDRLKPAISAGVDNLQTLPRGKPEDVRREVLDALQQAGPRPIMISPGCTYASDQVPDENLRALIDAARQK